MAERQDPLSAAGDRDAFVAHADRLAARVAAAAVETAGGVAWPLPGRGRPSFHLYDGTLGVALFLAAHARLRGADAHRDLALRAAAPLRRTLVALVRDPAKAAETVLPLGGMIGLGGYVYGLVRIGGWLESPETVRDAGEAAALFTDARIGRDERLDVVGGCAGAVLALLALDRAGAGPAAGRAPVDAAGRCADRLLERRASLPGTPRGWPSSGAPPIGGLAHGAAGVSLALFRLHARTGRPALREAAAEGLAFERALYDADADNWRDPRTGRLLEQSAWCHGAPGIALARAAALGVHDDAETRGELLRALAATRSLPDTERDHLCCGNLGRADVLLRAGEALGDAALRREARALGRRAVRRAERRGGAFSHTPPGSEGFHPSLMWGAAGVGYALLRLAHPELLPSVLLLE